MERRTNRVLLLAIGAGIGLGASQVLKVSQAAAQAQVGPYRWCTGVSTNILGSSNTTQVWRSWSDGVVEVMTGSTDGSGVWHFVAWTKAP